MKKRFISILLCMAMAIGCIFVPTTASAADGEVLSFSQGGVVKCGKYLYSMSINYASKSKVIRTTTTGSEPKVIDDKVNSISSKLYSYKTKIYYLDLNKIKCYNTKTNKLSTFKTLKYGNKSAKKVSTLVLINNICPKGLIVEYYKKGTYLIDFKGKSKKIIDGKLNKLKSFYEYLTATDKYIFFRISEKKTKDVYTDRLYRYNLKKGSLKKMGTYKSDKISQVPYVSDSYVFKNKIVFISSSLSALEGTVYSMDKNGNNIKQLKSGGIGLKFLPGKNCVYVQRESSKGKYSLYKISSGGKVTTAIKPTELNLYKPYLVATTTTGYSLNIKMSKDYMSYDLYRNGKPSLKKGTLVMTGKSQGDFDEQFAMPLAHGTYKDMVLLTYAVMDMEDEENELYRTYLVNAKTGSYQLIA